MKPLPMICAFWFVVLGPSWASDQQNRFVELKSEANTVTFDLNTVQTIRPGRFMIVETTVDNPDVMRLELKALEALRDYCALADGLYPAPTDLLTLGAPDLPVESIEVKSGQSEIVGPYKVVIWRYPYKRLASVFGKRLDCNPDGTINEFYYSKSLALITNGLRSREVFDCKQGLWGPIWRDEEDPAKAILYVLQKDTAAFGLYRTVCQAVTNETPYVPQ